MACFQPKKSHGTLYYDICSRTKTRRYCHWDVMYLVSFHHVSTILEKLGWKSFITLLTHNSGGILYPSSCISLLVQASILLFLIRVFLCSFNSSCPPVILSWNLLGLLCHLLLCSHKVRHCSQSIKQVPHFGSWLLFSHLLVGVSFLRKAESSLVQSFYCTFTTNWSCFHFWKFMKII